MAEVCRVSVCGFDPMLVKGYVKTGARALWFYLPDELYLDYKLSPGDKVLGKLLAVYDYKGEKTAAPAEAFEWVTAKESGLAVLIPATVITKYELTEFHFVELTLEKVLKMANGETGREEIVEETDVYPGKEMKRKFWPQEKMKLDYHLNYVAP
ncbi:MAG: hypothetical protein IH577_03755 [Deltaproteobacteria bacterium]|nr:hypothetical protein [Deltaproteobacteria bacterium]